MYCIAWMFSGGHECSAWPGLPFFGIDHNTFRTEVILHPGLLSEGSS